MAPASDSNFRRPRRIRGMFVCALMLATLVATRAPAADPAPPARTLKFQITGLFAADRVDDFREAVKKMPEIKLVNVDFANAEATFEIEPKKAFAGAKPEQIVQRFDALLRSASNGTFGAKEPRTTPIEKLKWVEIGVVGHDCKGCCLAAYESIFKLDGVEQATASFKEGRVRALIDPATTDRAKLEEALKKRGVQLK
jgi:copper chaperone CopZ